MGDLISLIHLSFTHLCNHTLSIIYAITFIQPSYTLFIYIQIFLFLFLLFRRGRLSIYYHLHILIHIRVIYTERGSKSHCKNKGELFISHSHLQAQKVIYRKLNRSLHFTSNFEKPSKKYEKIKDTLSAKLFCLGSVLFYFIFWIFSIFFCRYWKFILSAFDEHSCKTFVRA